MHSVTLDEIHQDPSILDRAIAQHESLKIITDGKLAGTLVPADNASSRGAGDGSPADQRALRFPLVTGVPGVLINPTREQLSDF